MANRINRKARYQSVLPLKAQIITFFLMKESFINVFFNNYVRLNFKDHRDNILKIYIWLLKN